MSDDKTVFMRAYPAQIQQSGERQLTGRLVPYDVTAMVLDFLDDGKPDIYTEGFRRGAFEGQVESGSREKGVLTKIGLIHRHDGGLGYLGPFVGLRDEPDGLWGDVNILPSKADDVLSLLRSGVDELSVEFRLRPGDNTVTDDHGVRWRTRAHLDQVALEPKGAYRGAAVIAMRADMDKVERERAQHDEDAAAAEERARADKEEADRIAAAQVAEAEDRIARRAAWDALVGRLPEAQHTQREFVKAYGVTAPGGYDHHRR